MRNIGWNILVLSLALIDSAQVPKKCPAPPEYPHTRLSSKHSGVQTFVSGQKVYYDCGEDFTPSRGSRAAECVSGKWTKLTLKCEKKSCGNAGDLPNGEFQYEGNSFLGEKVYAVCNEGYSVKGLDYMICKRSGWTGDFPSCEEGVASCPSPAVANSVSGAGDVRFHRLGASVTVACGRGFQLDGAQRITCGPGGLWQPDPPLCRPSPSKTPDSDGRCGVPVTHGNASLADKYITLTSFASGVRVHYVCDVGYVPAGGSRYRRCIMGRWTPLLLKCERKPCGSAGEIVNGQFLYTGVEFGDAATAVCDEGHSLVGQATRTCMSQGWDGRVPTCEAVVCATPLSGGTTAEMIFPQEPPYAYRSVIRYHCSAGTLIGPSHIWCTEDGRWSDLPPRCEGMTCSSPNVAKAYWMGDHTQLYHSRDTISIECNRGYVRTGPAIITCGADGRWSPGLPKCTPRRRNWRG